MDWPPILTLVGAVLTSLLTVIGTIYVARSKTKTDIGVSITNGFQALTDQLQQERTELNEIINRQRLANDACHRRIEFLNAKLRRRDAHIDTLERMLTILDRKPPKRVPDDPEPGD